MIRSTRNVAAPATVVHAVLTDVRAWRLWSPHVARGPATRMDVTWCEPGRGIRWASTAAGYRLEYADLIDPDAVDGDSPDRCTVTMTAQLSGPAGGTVERAVAPLSAYGQRRRLERLGALAEYVHRWAAVRPS